MKYNPLSIDIIIFSARHMNPNQQDQFFFEDAFNSSKDIQGTSCLADSEPQRKQSMVANQPPIFCLSQSSVNAQIPAELYSSYDDSQEPEFNEFLLQIPNPLHQVKNKGMPYLMETDQEGDITKKLKNHIFKECQRGTQYKNVARFFVRMIHSYAPQYFGRLDQQIVLKIERDLAENEGFIPGIWNLIQFMDNQDYGEQASKINREVYHQILKKYSIQQMKHPKSQIKKNRVEYLRVAKVLALRCRHRSLISRFQSH